MASKQQINIVWLKRDLRSQDHLPLQLAEESGLPYLIIFVFEPLMMDYPDTSLRHLQFQYQSLLQLNKKWTAYNKEVIIFNTDMITVLETIKSQFTIKTIYSYQESGIQLTYDRDKLIKQYFSARDICHSKSKSTVKSVKKGTPIFDFIFTKIHIWI